MIARCCCVTAAGFRVPIPSHVERLRGGARPRSYRGTRPRFASGTLMSLRRPPKPPCTRQIAYRRAHREATFSGSALRVSHGRSPQRSKERAERPGDGCPCVGAEETCSAPRSLGRREVPTHPTPVGTRANTVFQASNTRARGNIYTPALKTVFIRGTQKSRRFRRISGIFFEVRPLGLEPRTH